MAELFQNVFRLHTSPVTLPRMTRKAPEFWRSGTEHLRGWLVRAGRETSGRGEEVPGRREGTVAAQSQLAGVDVLLYSCATGQLAGMSSAGLPGA